MVILKTNKKGLCKAWANENVTVKEDFFHTSHVCMLVKVQCNTSLNSNPSPFCLSPVFISPGRGRGGRGGYKDDRRDRYSGGGRSGFGGSSYRDRDGDRGFGSGPKSAFGGSKAQNGGGYGGNSANSGGSYGNNNYGNSNGQGNFGAPANQVGAFGNQSFQGPPQFGAMQRAAQNGMNHPPFPFNSQPPPPQAQQPPPPPPMVPYPMPPPFPQ